MSKKLIQKTLVIFLLILIHNVTADYINIKNIGVPGINETNQEFTAVKTVYLELNYSTSATACRYANHNSTSVPPQFNSIWYTHWEPCIHDRIWELWPEDGLKIVYYQINYSGTYALYNDTIYFNHTGSGLDLTPAIPPVVEDGTYTNNNKSITISWHGAYDPESQILNIPIYYWFRLYTGSGVSLTDVITTQTSVTSSVNLPHGTIVYANVTVINSAHLLSSTVSDGLIIDLVKPNMTALYGSFLNASSGTYMTLPYNPDTWVWATTLNFSWAATDNYPNTISGFSYIFTSDISALPDNVPEGVPPNLGDVVSAVIQTGGSDKFYFRVKPRDEAGNWGEPYELTFSVDNTPPTEPIITDEISQEGNLTYFWSPSQDPQSNITNYMLNLTKPGYSTYALVDNIFNYTFMYLDTGQYSVIIGALNGVGIWSWAGTSEHEVDFTPPEISVSPSGEVVGDIVIHAWTDEQAVCFYNISSFVQMFTYTNTTYHEVKHPALEPGNYKFNVTCSDQSGNIGFSGGEFSVGSSYPDILETPDVDTYEDILTTIGVNLSYGTTKLSGLTGEFKVLVQNTEIESSTFDQGNGVYNISFFAPSESGTYNLVIKYEDLQDNAILNVGSLTLGCSYSDPLIVSVERMSNLVYNTPELNRQIGLAADLSPVVSLYSLDVSNVDLQSNLYIFNTLSSPALARKNRLLQSAEFDDLITPTFGHTLDQVQLVEFTLAPYDYDIKSESNEIKRGKYNFIIRKTQSRSGRYEIQFIR